MDINNLPVNDLTVQALAAQFAHVQQGLSVLTAADAWGATAAWSRTYNNRGLVVHHPCWFLQAVLAGEHLSNQRDIERLNAIMRAIDVAADDDSSSPFSEILQRELKVTQIVDVTFTQWSYAADRLGQDRAWRDSMYETHSDLAQLT
ncbi:MAG: hypothetical protein F6K00_34945 [Leptolyngbya sp. SIOISBB]|nr:hypothetical protein [Leptolyngbya sp. SIOISBB]